MDVNSVEDLRAAAYGLASGRGDDVDVVTRLGLAHSERADLSLDPAESRQVAVTDVDDPHER